MFQENYEKSVALNAFIILPLLPLLQLEKQPQHITQITGRTQRAPTSVKSQKLLRFSFSSTVGNIYLQN